MSAAGGFEMIRRCRWLRRWARLGCAVIVVIVGVAGSAGVLGCQAGPADRKLERPTNRLTVYAAGDQPFGDITVTPRGQVVVSLQSQFSPTANVVRVPSTSSWPFTRLTEAPVDVFLNMSESPVDMVAGLHASRKWSPEAPGAAVFEQANAVWLLDNDMRRGGVPALVRAALVDGSVDALKRVPLPGWPESRSVSSRVARSVARSASRPGSFVDDFVMDDDETFAVVTERRGRRCALIVIDLVTGEARRVLEDHVSVVAEDIDLVIDGRLIADRAGTPTIPTRIGVNPIAMDVDATWIYFGPTNGRTLYRVPTAALRDASLSPAKLAAKVERYADKPICDGIAIDAAGNIYVTDLAANAVGVITPARQYTVLFQDDELLSWPSSIAIGPGGYVYVTASQSHRGPTGTRSGESSATLPFYILQFSVVSPTFMAERPADVSADAELDAVPDAISHAGADAELTADVPGEAD